MSVDDSDRLVIRAVGVMVAMVALALLGAISYDQGLVVSPVGLVSGVVLTPVVRWLVGQYSGHLVEWPVESDASEPGEHSWQFMLGLLGLFVALRIVIAIIVWVPTLRWAAISLSATHLLWATIEGVRWLVDDVSS